MTDIKIMRNLYILTVFTVILGSWNLCASAQNVDFPDANLAAAVRISLGLAEDADIPLASLQELTQLYADNFEITNLSGLEKATSLTSLAIRDNPISDFAPLGSLINLTLLNLINTTFSISDLTILSPLTSLRRLLLSGNEISDLTDLPAFPNLESLELNRNQITNLTPLANLTAPTKLTFLSLSDNQISDITPLARFTGLTDLFLSVNNIRNLSPLAGLTNLELLRISSNQVSDLTPLAGLTKLRDLYFFRNQVSDLTPLAGLTELRDLRFFNNQVSDLTPLAGLTELRVLHFVSNQVSDLNPLAGLTELRTLVICYNPYTDISPLQNLVNLSTLFIDEVFVEANEALVGATTNATLRLCPPLPTQPTTSGGGGGGGGGGRTISKLSFPGQIGFSELMFASGGGLDSLPQWIELCNASKTETVNLWGWRLEMEAGDANGEFQHAVITFKDLLIPPNQTALIVTSEAPNSVDLPKERVYNFFTHHRSAFKDNADHNSVLGQMGFFLKLSDPGGAVSDVAGNLDGDSETEDAPAWVLPNGITSNAARTSVFRQYDPTRGTPLDGKISENWGRAADVQLDFITYWGKYTDIGNPGRKGGWKFPYRRISISELMFTSRGGLHSLPQWIELYNTSETQTVDLRGWQLKIEGRDDDGEHRYAVITLDGFLIPPNQTALIVTSIARSSGVRQGVYILSSRHPDAFKLNRHQNQNQVLGQTGFFLKLSDPDGIVTDIAGNLDGNKLTEDKPKWELPAGITPDGARTSLMRRYYRAADIPLDGKKSASWILCPHRKWC